MAGASRYGGGVSSDPGDSLAQPTEPLDVDGVSAMVAGTVAWAVALVVLLISGTRFDGDNGWWLWVCLVGIGIGIVGVVYTRRRRAVYQAAREREGRGKNGAA
jgi:hypothetical protein